MGIGALEGCICHHTLFGYTHIHRITSSTSLLYFKEKTFTFGAPLLCTPVKHEHITSGHVLLNSDAQLQLPSNQACSRNQRHVLHHGSSRASLVCPLTHHYTLKKPFTICVLVHHTSRFLHSTKSNKHKKNTTHHPPKKTNHHLHCAPPIMPRIINDAIIPARQPHTATFPVHSTSFTSTSSPPTTQSMWPTPPPLVSSSISLNPRPLCCFLLLLVFSQAPQQNLVTLQHSCA